MKALVHIGSPKTGTSSIQRYLQHNRAALAQQGIRYQRSSVRRGSQWELPMIALMAEDKLLPNEVQRARYKAIDSAMQKRTFGHIPDWLRKFPGQYDEPLALFSSEHMLPWLRTPDLVARMDAIFRESFDEVQYLVYIREQGDLVTSEYSERVKRGTDVTFDDFFDNRLNGLNHFRVLSRWTDVVGQDRLTVRRMDREVLKDGDLLKDFCAVCGIDFDKTEVPGRVNEALSAVGCEVMRALNTRIPELLPDGRANPLRRGLLHRVITMTDGMGKLRLTADQAARLAQKVKHSNSRVLDTFFPDDAALFSKPSAVAAAQDRQQAREQALEIMAELIVKHRLGEIPRLNPITRLRALRNTPHAPAPKDRMKNTAGES